MTGLAIVKLLRCSPAATCLPVRGKVTPMRPRAASTEVQRGRRRRPTVLGTEPGVIRRWGKSDVAAGKGGLAWLGRHVAAPQPAPTSMRTFLPVSISLAAALLASGAQAQSPGTLDKVKANGSISVAYRESSIPFSYLNDKAEPVGFGWEICGKVVDEVKKATGRADLKVVANAVTSQNRIPLLQNGTIDIECGSTTNNSERGKQVAFAINYFYTGTRLLVKSNSPVKDMDDLAGKTVVSTTGTTN